MPMPGARLQMPGHSVSELPIARRDARYSDECSARRVTREQKHSRCHNHAQQRLSCLFVFFRRLFDALSTSPIPFSSWFGPQNAGDARGRRVVWAARTSSRSQHVLFEPQEASAEAGGRAGDAAPKGGGGGEGQGSRRGGALKAERGAGEARGGDAGGGADRAQERGGSGASAQGDAGDARQGG
eukprot:267535-Prymnesium_polylepis.2